MTITEDQLEQLCLDWFRSGRYGASWKFRGHNTGSLSAL